LFHRFSFFKENTAIIEEGHLRIFHCERPRLKECLHLIAAFLAMMLLVEALNRLSAVDLGEEDPNMCVAVYTW